MASTAATNLAALQNIGGDVAQVEDAQTALARVTPDRSAAPIQDADAEFGTPEAIATAVAASFILGPIGGLLLGGAQGWLKKRADQSVLDQIATEQTVLTDSAAVYDDVLQGFKDSATTEEDLAQVAVLEAQRTAAVEMMTSGDVALRDQGMEAFAKFEAGLQGYSTLQETQLIAKDAEEARQRVELDDRQFSRFTGMQDDFATESEGYLAVSQSINTALAALQNGTPADLHAAVVLVNKALDPESVVRAEEAAAFGNMGSALERGFQFVGEQFEGQTLTANQRRNLGGLLLNIKDQSTRFQLTREARFSDQVIDADLPAKYHDNFRLVENVPSSITLDIAPDALDRDRAERAAMTKAITDAPAAVRSAFDEFVNTDRGEAATIGAAFDLLNPTRPGPRLPTN